MKDSRKMPLSLPAYEQYLKSVASAKPESIIGYTYSNHPEDATDWPDGVPDWLKEFRANADMSLQMGLQDNEPRPITAANALVLLRGTRLYRTLHGRLTHEEGGPPPNPWPTNKPPNREETMEYKIMRVEFNDTEKAEGLINTLAKVGWIVDKTIKRNRRCFYLILCRDTADEL